jgi:hypothetical protein
VACRACPNGPLCRAPVTELRLANIAGSTELIPIASPTRPRRPHRPRGPRYHVRRHCSLATYRETVTRKGTPPATPGLSPSDVHRPGSRNVGPSQRREGIEPLTSSMPRKRATPGVVGTNSYPWACGPSPMMKMAVTLNRGAIFRRVSNGARGPDHDLSPHTAHYVRRTTTWKDTPPARGLSPSNVHRHAPSILQNRGSRSAFRFTVDLRWLAEPVQADRPVTSPGVLQPAILNRTAYASSLELDCRAPVLISCRSRMIWRMRRVFIAARGRCQ